MVTLEFNTVKPSLPKTHFHSTLFVFVLIVMSGNFIPTFYEM